MRHVTAFVLSATLATAATRAQALRVPSQYATIGAALAAASPGTTILVAPGTYTENLTWPSVDGIRLIAEQGPTVTVIDGTQSGRVIYMATSFSTPLTRATVLEGFTITGGWLQGSQNYGAGIYIDEGAPTVRGNRITGNASDGSRNYGGGIYVGGSTANPLIAHNEIDDNELRNGSWNFGAGVYLSGPAAVIGNTIHDNRTRSTNASTLHRGHGAGVYVSATGVLVASNLITANANNTTAWNRGGGVKIATQSVATLVNNTIAGNSVSGGNWNDGGGVHLAGNSAATMRGNLVCNNTGQGIYVSFSYSPGPITTDYDDVWGNSGLAYDGLQPGPNNLSVDPMFVSATDYHLQPGSPCVDAMPATATSGVAHLDAGVDVDGDPRLIETSVAAPTPVDLGADELSRASLSGAGSPQIGATFDWVVASSQPGLGLLGTAWSTGNIVFADGNQLLASSYVFLGSAATPASFSLAVPNNPAFRGLTLHGQGYVLPTNAARGQYTNRLTITTY